MLMEKFSRRDFLKGSGALVVTFSLAHPVAQAAEKGKSAPKTVALDQVDGFVAIVTMDANGNSLHAEVEANTGAALAGLVS